MKPMDKQFINYLQSLPAGFIHDLYQFYMLDTQHVKKHKHSMLKPILRLRRTDSRDAISSDEVASLYQYLSQPGFDLTDLYNG